MEGEIADVTTELYDVIVERVDPVEVPANRRLWAIAKEDTKRSVPMAEVEKKVEIVQPAPTPEPEVVQKAEFENVQKENLVLKDRVVALEKANRMKDLEPVCKELGLEAEKVWKLEAVDKASADYMVGKLDEAHKRITALMKELGSAGQPVEQDEFMAKAEKLAKAEKITLAQAIAKVNETEPQLYDQYVNKMVGKKGGR